MDFLQLARERYSVRKFLTDKVEDDKLQKILEAGRIAPTSGNNQPQKILVLQNKIQLDKLKKAADIYNAPLALIVCGEHKNLWKRPFDQKNLLDIDISIVTDHMMMEATAQDLGSVWICYFNPYIIKKEFNLSATLEPINILAIGYADKDAFNLNKYHNDRKSIDDIIQYI